MYIHTPSFCGNRIILRLLQRPFINGEITWISRKPKEKEKKKKTLTHRSPNQNQNQLKIHERCFSKQVENRR